MTRLKIYQTPSQSDCFFYFYVKALRIIAYKQFTPNQNLPRITQLIILAMFQGRNMICSLGFPASSVCTNPQCSSYLFVCSRKCGCFHKHKDSCILKNIVELSNGIETVLKRNFSKQSKGEGIEIIARVARQTKPAPRNFRFCLTECKAETKRDMQFLIRNVQGCVGVGVVHKPTVASHLYQYIPDKDYINHGAYMVLSNGYQYSHFNPKQNFVEFQGISLDQGKKVRVFMENHYIVLEQNCNQVRLSLPQNPESLEGLYYGVYLYDENDSVEILAKT